MPAQIDLYPTMRTATAEVVENRFPAALVALLETSIGRKGECMKRLFAAAAALGELAVNGWITDAAITHYLTDAGRRHLGVAGFSWTELTTTIRDGIKTGREKPRHIPGR